jgi:hypothetical protein
VFQPRNLFLDWLEERTADDGHDLGAKLAELFQTLDTPEDARGALLDEDLAAFPYVNGDLFKGATRIPAFNAEMREALLASSRFDWSPISPAIFGSLFQSVMNKEERRKAGRALHDREEHFESDQPAVHGRAAGGVRSDQQSQARTGRRIACLPVAACIAELPRSRVRVRKFPDHCLPRTTASRN